jgi:hypothetical protein
MSLPPPRRARTTSAENPFASFYESRRKLSLEADDDDTADPSSSITRAYTVPDALLALARGERESSPVISSPVISSPVISSPVSTRRMVATHRADVATPSTSMFPFRSSPRLGSAEWRAVQRIALSVAGWLRRAWRRSIPN